MLSQNIDQGGDVLRRQAQEGNISKLLSAQSLEIRHPPAQQTELGFLIDQRQPRLDSLVSSAESFLR